jgi:hypothetical protein
MNRFLGLCALALLLAGCSGNSPVSAAPKEHPGKPAVAATPTPTPEPSDKQKIALLRAEAHKRHLRWRVWCVDLGEDWQFQGWAVQPGDDFHVYAEDGAKPNWGSHGTTEAETAYNLYLEIQQPPTDPLHAPSSPSGHKKHCPPELHGD